MPALIIIMRWPPPQTTHSAQRPPPGRCFRNYLGQPLVSKAQHCSDIELKPGFAHSIEAECAAGTVGHCEAHPEDLIFLMLLQFKLSLVS